MICQYKCNDKMLRSKSKACRLDNICEFAILYTVNLTAVRLTNGGARL